MVVVAAAAEACAGVPARVAHPLAVVATNTAPVEAPASPLENRWIPRNVADFSRGSRKRARFLRTTVRTRVPRLFDELLSVTRTDHCILYGFAESDVR